MQHSLWLCQPWHSGDNNLNPSTCYGRTWYINILCELGMHLVQRKGKVKDSCELGMCPKRWQMSSIHMKDSYHWHPTNNPGYIIGSSHLHLNWNSVIGLFTCYCIVGYIRLSCEHKMHSIKKSTYTTMPCQTAKHEETNCIKLGRIQIIDFQLTIQVAWQVQDNKVHSFASPTTHCCKFLQMLWYSWIHPSSLWT
jgi:hypothetical protein